MKFAILGTGIMGRGWITQCAMTAHEVHCFDANPEILAGVAASCEKLTATAAKKFKIDDADFVSNAARKITTYEDKGAFIEAANVIVRHRHHSNWRRKYVVHLYERTRRRKGHAVAVGATARYLAESTYWVLKKNEPYREPPHWAPGGKKSPVSLNQGKARA